MRNSTAAATSTIPTFPLLLWVVPQLLALGIGISRVSLWARYPQPGELMSLRLLLTTQFAISSLLFPILLRDRDAIAVVLASSWPLALIAGSLSATSVTTTLGCELFVASWLVCLACLNQNFTSANATRFIVPFTSLWAIGGPLLLYLRYEFADQRPPLDGLIVGPIVGLQHHLSGEAGWLSFTICFGVIAIAAAAPRLLRKALSTTGA